MFSFGLIESRLLLQLLRKFLPNYRTEQFPTGAESGGIIFNRQQWRDRALAVLDVAARHGVGVAEVDLSAGGAGRAEGETAELEAGGGGLGALANQVERELAIFRLGVVVEHFEPIDDGAHRADEIMTDPRAQERREFERIWSSSGSG